MSKSWIPITVTALISFALYCNHVKQSTDKYDIISQKSVDINKLEEELPLVSMLYRPFTGINGIIAPEYRHCALYFKGLGVCDFNKNQEIKWHTFSSWMHNVSSLYVHDPKTSNIITVLDNISRIQRERKYTSKSYDYTNGIDCETFVLESLGLPVSRTQWDTAQSPLNIRSTGRKMNAYLIIRT